MTIQNFRHATEDRIPELEKLGFEVVSYIYDRGGKSCFLMREKPKQEPARQANGGKGWEPK